MIWRPPEGFRKDVAFSPAYDRRHWPGNFGIHGVDLWLALIGPKGAVEFRVFTNWFLPQVEEKLAERMRRGEPIGNPFEPDAAGFWYDARQPLEGWPEPEPCPSCGWLDGDPCYHYMGDVVPSMDLLSDLIAQGEEKFWQGMMRAQR